MHHDPLPASDVTAIPPPALDPHGEPPAIPRATTFERIEEYTALLEQHDRLSSRRQNLNDVFVAINTIFLTAIGLLLVQSRLDSWWIVGSIGVITLAITPINAIWRTVIDRYKGEIKVHVEYLSAIEREFRRRREASEGPPHDPPYEGEIPIGFYLYNSLRRRPHGGKARLEKRLANYFIVLYPLITLLVAAVTYLVIMGMIPPGKL